MIYYLGHYSCEQIASEYRRVAPPAKNKMGYILSVLSKVSKNHITVVSPCETELRRYVKGGTHNLTDNMILKTFGSFRGRNRLLRGVGYLWVNLQAFLYLLGRVKSNDTVIVYHSLSLMKMVKVVRWIKKFSLIIEVEELYSDVKEDAALRKKELEYLQIADKYIMITELLNKEVNLRSKPMIISHGTYQVVPNHGRKFKDGKIHVVYAGSFNPIKGGAFSAIEAAEFLDEGFVLHILGKGTDADTTNIIEKIRQVSSKTKCQIVYDGYKTGMDFDSFIQSCHIGLSTQQPDGKYNASSFPSKILMYMSNGLHVVSVRIPAVESSVVGDILYYYNCSSALEIAQAIKSVSLENEAGIIRRLNDLNQEFENSLSALLKI